jgi:hypothetical protein
VTLPSPIPHPASYVEFTPSAGDWREAIEAMVGEDWPEGDEKAMRELAEQ